MARERFLVVEDEPKISGVLKNYLEQSNFSVTILDRGDKVTDAIKAPPPALMLLDIMLPGADGIEVCREVRKVSTLPIIMVTAKVEEIDRLIGLEIGADDDICKPFSPREVVARVKAANVGLWDWNLVINKVLYSTEWKRQIGYDDHEIKVILCTGYSKNISDEMAMELGIKAFTYKPIVQADPAKTVRKVLDDTN